LDPVDLVAGTLVVDECARPELTDSEKAGALDVLAAVFGAGTGAGHVCREWQAREGVSRQEAFRREVAVRVEVGLADVALLVLQQVELVAGVVLASSCGFPGSH
jgi:hypothetical protein